MPVSTNVIPSLMIISPPQGSCCILLLLLTAIEDTNSRHDRIGEGESTVKGFISTMKRVREQFRMTKYKRPHFFIDFIGAL